jgi:hypothetical protein
MLQKSGQECTSESIPATKANSSDISEKRIEVTLICGQITKYGTLLKGLTSNLRQLVHRDWNFHFRVSITSTVLQFPPTAILWLDVAEAYNQLEVAL